VIAIAACGGKPPPQSSPPKEPPKAVANRVVVESDSEPEDGVTIINPHGRMEQKAVEAGLASHREDLSACYMSKVGRRRWLGGHVVIRWDIKKDGTVTSVKLAESDLGAWPIEKCLIDVARSATFDKPIGGDADFTIPLDFSSKGALQVWDEDQAARAVGGQLAKLDACKEAPADVVVTAYVGPRGKTQSIGFSSGKSEIGDKWADCAQKAALAWKLPDPKGMITKLAIRYRSR
jgi:TonB family protein